MPTINGAAISIIGAVTACVVAFGVVGGGSLWLGSISATVTQQATGAIEAQKEAAELRAKLDETSNKLIQTTSKVEDLIGEVKGMQDQQQNTSAQLREIVKDVDRLIYSQPSGKRGAN